jgi:hypothetical protein
VIFVKVRVSLCGKLCAQQNSAKICEANKYMSLAYAKLVAEHVGDRCDYCAVAYKGVSVNRCSRCLTKVYCGEECRDQGWVVHKLVCREGEVERKKKAGKQARKQEGREKVNQLEKFAGSLGR